MSRRAGVAVSSNMKRRAADIATCRVFVRDSRCGVVFQVRDGARVNHGLGGGVDVNTMPGVEGYCFSWE